jgi:hypothetical protein
MASGFDKPAKSIESNSPASIPFEAVYLEQFRIKSTGRTEPPVLDFTAPNTALVSSQNSVEVAEARRPELGRARISTDTERQNSAAERLPEQYSQSVQQRTSPAVWDPSRPGWDQPQLGPRQLPAPGDSTRKAQPSEKQTLPDDRQRAPERPVFRAPQDFKLSDRLDARTMGRIPDAKVFVNPDFDPAKPVNLIVYNHGWNDTISSAPRTARLQEQMSQAPPNSILIVPSWQKVDGAANGIAHQKFKTGFIGAIDATMKLNGKTLSEISNITIVSHSAGYNAVAHELNQLRTSPLYDRVSTLASFDSQYETKQAVDDWIEHNLKNGKFANGKAAFINLWTPETASLSSLQAESIARLVGRNPNLIDVDYGRRRHGPIAPRELARTPIVFANTRDEHMNLPVKFFGHAISKLSRQNR